MTQEVALVARFRAAPGRRDELVEACRGAVASAAGEEGTLEYRLHTDASDPDTVVFYERYRDQGAFDAHKDSEALATFMGSIGSLLGGKPVLTFLSPVTEA
ncbi:putative quinol monooxygenase [Actinomycetospora sp. TBRC 11914]|uniref:putative quinol monooxygenase n=1 Tax=Actinomycetospora sp. TBRC 11914 TaxID=2729387 RepID=UPI00145CD729|nr:putative quinol monooxygenase [Actinomycetospora sp. TBRC 11914]NMO91575.1 antibiotic biosynthesis monooxygenase [Actinomycetospora sp. TBRC 11914]